MISSNIFRFLAAAGALSLGALAAPAQAAVFQASTDIPIAVIDAPIEIFFSLPQYSGPGTIVGVNIALSGSAVEADYYPLDADGNVTVAPYSRTWFFSLLGPVGPSDGGAAFLTVSTTAKFPGGSCVDFDCGSLGFITVSSGPNAFSGNANLSDFSDYAGTGTNAFGLGADAQAPGESALNGSATVTETLLITVPEAPTWVMAFIGFALVGFAAHSRRVARPLAGV